MTESSGREVLVFKYRRGRQEVRKKYACMQPVFLFFSPPLLPLVSMALKMVVAAIVPLSFGNRNVEHRWVWWIVRVGGWEDSLLGESVFFQFRKSDGRRGESLSNLPGSTCLWQKHWHTSSSLIVFFLFSDTTYFQKTEQALFQWSVLTILKLI